MCGLRLCSGCAAELRTEITARVNALVGERAERIAAEKISAHIPLDERDPIERILSSVFLALGRAGIETLFRCMFSRHVLQDVVERRRALQQRHADLLAGGEPPEELGVACARELAAHALSRALDAVANPSTPIDAALPVIRTAVEYIRTGAEIARVADLPEQPEMRPKRRRIIDVSPRPKPRAA